MKSIDVKSLLIGILGTALVIVLMGVTHNKENYQVTCVGGQCLLWNTTNGVTRILGLKDHPTKPQQKYAKTNWHYYGEKPDF